MKKRLLFALLFICFAISAFTQILHPIYIEIVTENGQHPDQATFSAYLNNNTTQMITEQSPSCSYYGNGSGAYQGTVAIQCEAFYGYNGWQIGDTLYVTVNSELGNGQGSFVINNGNYQFFGDMYGTYSEGDGIFLSDTIPIPDANFTATPLEGDAPLTVHFTNQSSQDVTQWFWDFDYDGVIDSNEENPTWVYNDSRIYRVYLCVFNGDNYGDAEIKLDYITVSYVGSDNDELPNVSFDLSNHPNPFNPETVISYKLPQNTKNAKIEIYNLKGQLLEILPINTTRTSVNWKADKYSSGVYLYRLNINGKTKAVKKCILMK